jgi:hypothetical protein
MAHVMEAAMTIRRTRRLVPVLVLLLVACVPSNALAFWGWIEELSGPGPYWGFQFPFDRLICIVKPDGARVTTSNRFVSSGRDKDTEKDKVEKDKVEKDKVEKDKEYLACANDGGVTGVQIRGYLSVEFSRANSKANDLFPAVAFTSIKPVLFYRVPHVREFIDIGAGFGGNRFSGNDFAFWRWSVPLRGRIFWPGLKSGSRWRGLHLALQADYFPMTFTSADFQIPPGYESHHKFVRSAFLSVDLLRLIR